MKLFKLKSITTNQLKRYFIYAIGELCLIVLGILVALYINNNNDYNQYKKKIDNNFLRVYSELENNIKETKETIEKIREKDSLIYLVMNDSVTAEMYYRDLSLSYLILSFYNLNLEVNAYHNLISLNISDNKYKEGLISNLKELYSINENIKDVNKTMSTFVYDKSLPLLANNTNSFGDLTYKRQLKKDVIDFFTTSNIYKSYVSHYEIIAIKNQLRHAQNFLKTAYDLQSKIAKEYNLKNENLILKETIISQFKGLYVNSQLKDTLAVKYVDNSMQLSRKWGQPLKLLPITDHSYFVVNEGSGLFVSFLKNDPKNSINLKINISAFNYIYNKIE